MNLEARSFNLNILKATLFLLVAHRAIEGEEMGTMRIAESSIYYR